MILFFGLAWIGPGCDGVISCRRIFDVESLGICRRGPGEDCLESGRLRRYMDSHTSMYLALGTGVSSA